MSTACYINKLTLDEYAREAFIYEQGVVIDQGGIYAGHTSKYADPKDPKIHAHSRLVTVAGGKYFVRWVNSHIKTWDEAANGNWWTSDNCVQRIATETVKRYGPVADSSTVAREFSNVGYTWRGDQGDFGAKGTYRSDMKKVVICRTKFPVQVLTGLGRAVTNPTATGSNYQALTDVTLDSKEPQVVILCSVGADKTFRGVEFLDNVWFGSSVGFTAWWQTNNPLRARRPGGVVGV